MTSRLRGSSKEDPRHVSASTSKSRTYLSSSREPREKSTFEGSRNKVSRKDSRGKCEDRPSKIEPRYNETNGYASPVVYDDGEDEDPDLMYRRSRDHFGTWNIQDIISERESSDLNGAERSSERKSRFDLFRSANGTSEDRKMSNGGSRSKHRSPEDEERLESRGRRAELSGFKSPNSRTSRRNRVSLSPEAAIIRISKSPPGREIDSGINSPRYDDGEERSFHRPRRGERSQLLQDTENFSGDRRRRGSPERSVERRYAGGGNLSPDNPENDKIRLLIDRFKSGSNDAEKKRGKIRAGDDDGFGSMDRRAMREDSVDRKHSSPDRKARTRQWRSGERDELLESEAPVYRSLERRSGPRSNGEPGESSKRRSYVYSGSPEEFDVQIQRYDRALPGSRKLDAESGVRRNSSNVSASGRERGGDSSARRRSSIKIKEEDEEGRAEKNGRHNRPLTPPEERRAVAGFQGAKDWRESNKKFAVKYLKENSKLRSSDTRDPELGEEEPGIGHATRETYFGERRRGGSSPVRRAEASLEGDDDKRSKGYSARRIEPAVTIRIRNAAEERTEENERRSKNRSVFKNEEETRARNRRQDDGDADDVESRKKERRNSRDKDWTSTSTPSRKIWSYREGGAKITDVDKGQPCLKCGETCAGFDQHIWRKNCNSCKCPREAHDVCHEEWVSVRSRLGLKGDEASGSVACDPREMGLAWAPPGLPPPKVEEYFSMLPERSVPRLGTPGERYRDRQLAMQLPKQDLAKAYCRHLAKEHHTSADDFMAARNEIALDIGTVQEILETGASCAGCNESLKWGSLAVSAGKLGELYHPGCFQCVQCRELLVDLAYCDFNGAVYCERHYAERLKGRCAACDELIFSGEFTRAMNKDWHSGHFCCWQCDESLTGQRYVLRDEHPYCIKCYESVFANGCEECSKIIGIDSKDLSYKDKHWHEACFLCNKCRVSLVDKQFGSKVDKIYCGNCYDAQFASRCDGCGEIFRAGTKKMEYKTRQWHEKCFCCVVCKNPIGTKSFIPREQEIYCAGCYEDKFATRCVKCNKIITSGGVTYKNEPWHRECFTCSNCSTSLAGQRFTSRDEKPYCAECFGELFAKRCTACTKPITGIGGTRFISFEDRHWHNDCFICAGCKTSLVGHGFITDDTDIICPECAKQKLM